MFGDRQRKGAVLKDGKHCIKMMAKYISAHKLYPSLQSAPTFPGIYKIAKKPSRALLAKLLFTLPHLLSRTRLRIRYAQKT